MPYSSTAILSTESDLGAGERQIAASVISSEGVRKTQAYAATERFLFGSRRELHALSAGDNALEVRNEEPGKSASYDARVGFFVHPLKTGIGAGADAR